MRRVLVTGAVGGMGAAIVADLARDREVIATARNADRLAELTAATGATGWLGDLTDHAWLAAQVATLDRLCLPLLRASRGTVILIGSGASTRPVPGSAVYRATKHALKAYADVLRLDESRNGLRVSTVAPGPTATAMYETSQLEGGRPYEPERLIDPTSVANAVRFVLDATDDVHLPDVDVRPRQELR